jgi:hypothetical protein
MLPINDLSGSDKRLSGTLTSISAGVEAPQRDIARPLIKRPAKKMGDTEE